MDAVAQQVKHGCVWIFSLLIFFFNFFLLPEGMSLVLLLAPVWVYLLYAGGNLKKVIPPFLLLLVYVPIHLINGVNVYYYSISVGMIACLIFFSMAVFLLINAAAVNLDLIFRDIATLNIILTAFSVFALFLPALRETVWYMVPISDNIRPFPRLKLFSSEASHYSFLFAPIAIYFYSRALFFKRSNAFPTLLIVTIPLLLSFSLGVLLGLFISGVLILCFFYKRIFSSRRFLLRLSGIVFAVLSLLVFAYYVYPHNPLFVRIHNIFTGHDTSARGRTYEAFILANKIAATKSPFWGIGPGQLKLIGRDIVIQYYSYFKIPATIRIPNACAETIAYFGYFGLALRLMIELFLFVKTKVFLNPYRLWLFVFVFVYQFTGSYITNVSEYVVWILAFSNIFPEYISAKTPKLKSP